MKSVKMTMVALAVSMCVAPVALALDPSKVPQLAAANDQINQAKAQLDVARDGKRTWFGGHRVKAIKLLRQAQQEIELAAEWSDSDKP